jgi:hypothetical protein
MLCGMAGGALFRGLHEDISLVPHLQEHEK